MGFLCAATLGGTELYDSHNCPAFRLNKSVSRIDLGDRESRERVNLFAAIIATEENQPELDVLFRRLGSRYLVAPSHNLAVNLGRIPRTMRVHTLDHGCSSQVCHFLGASLDLDRQCLVFSGCSGGKKVGKDDSRFVDLESTNLLRCHKWQKEFADDHEIVEIANSHSFIETAIAILIFRSDDHLSSFLGFDS